MIEVSMLSHFEEIYFSFQNTLHDLHASQSNCGEKMWTNLNWSKALLNRYYIRWRTNHTSQVQLNVESYYAGSYLPFASAVVINRKLYSHKHIHTYPYWTNSEYIAILLFGFQFFLVTLSRIYTAVLYSVNVI